MTQTNNVMKTIIFLFAFTVSFFTARADSFQPIISKANAVTIHVYEAPSAEEVLLEEYSFEAELSVADVVADLQPTISATKIYAADGTLLKEINGAATAEQLPATASLLMTENGICYYICL